MTKSYLYYVFKIIISIAAVPIKISQNEKAFLDFHPVLDFSVYTT